MSRKRNHRMRARPDVQVVVDPIRASQLHTEAEFDRLTVPTKLALVRMLEGTGDSEHVGRLGWDINTAWVRVSQIGGDNAEVLARLEAACTALEEAKRIHQQHGRWGLTGPGRLALSEGVDIFYTVLRASSRRQMSDAEDLVIKAKRLMQAKSLG